MGLSRGGSLGTGESGDAPHTGGGRKKIPGRMQDGGSVALPNLPLPHTARSLGGSARQPIDNSPDPSIPHQARLLEATP